MSKKIMSVMTAVLVVFAVVAFTNDADARGGTKVLDFNFCIEVAPGFLSCGGYPVELKPNGTVKFPTLGSTLTGTWSQSGSDFEMYWNWNGADFDGTQISSNPQCYDGTLTAGSNPSTGLPYNGTWDACVQ